jgi:hypothetical protein
MQQTNKTQEEIISDYEVRISLLQYIYICNPMEQTTGIHLILFLLEEINNCDMEARLCRDVTSCWKKINNN